MADAGSMQINPERVIANLGARVASLAQELAVAHAVIEQLNEELTSKAEPDASS